MLNSQPCSQQQHRAYLNSSMHPSLVTPSQHSCMAPLPLGLARRLTTCPGTREASQLQGNEQGTHVGRRSQRTAGQHGWGAVNGSATQQAHADRSGRLFLALRSQPCCWGPSHVEPRCWYGQSVCPYASPSYLPVLPVPHLSLGVATTWATPPEATSSPYACTANTYAWPLTSPSTVVPLPAVEDTCVEGVHACGHAQKALSG